MEDGNDLRSETISRLYQETIEKITKQVQGGWQDECTIYRTS